VLARFLQAKRRSKKIINTILGQLSKCVNKYKALFSAKHTRISHLEFTCAVYEFNHNNGTLHEGEDCSLRAPVANFWVYLFNYVCKWEWSHIMDQAVVDRPIMDVGA